MAEFQWMAEFQLISAELEYMSELQLIAKVGLMVVELMISADLE